MEDGQRLVSEYVAEAQARAEATAVTNSEETSASSEEVESLQMTKEQLEVERQHNLAEAIKLGRERAVFEVSLI